MDPMAVVNENRPSGTNTEGLSQDREGQRLVRQLMRKNAMLRREVERLQVYRMMAYRDPLTGLHNRRYFQERVREEQARATRADDYGFALVLIDVDDFKKVNDSLGHETGDQVLMAVADFLQASVREIDIVVRLGGDEFALLLPSTDDEGCRVVIDRLRETLTEQQGFPCPVRLSIGAASHHPGPHKISDLFAKADTAMYRDKRTHKSTRTSRPRKA